MNEYEIPKVFPVEDNINKINFKQSEKGKFGFVVSQKYGDNLMYLPRFESVKDGHEQSIRFFTRRLFKEKFKFYQQYLNKIKTVCPEEECFIDIEEMSYAMFLTSLNNIAFLNTTLGDLTSGLLFIPKDRTYLTDKDNEIITNMYNSLTDEDLCRIVEVPSFQATMIDNEYPIIYELEEYNYFDSNKKRI